MNAEIMRLVGARMSWSTGLEISHRDFRNVVPGVALTPELLAEGYQLKQKTQMTYELWRSPERRLTLSSAVSSLAGRIWSQPGQSFEKIQGSLAAHWFPQAKGDDYEMQWRVQAGKTFGQVPFDELFILGVERDNDLWMRAHIGTRDRRKGSAPLGENYFLSNWETDKNLYSNGIFTVRLGPLLDTGKITDSSSNLGTQKWLFDTGAQAKVAVFGVGVIPDLWQGPANGKQCILCSCWPMRCRARRRWKDQFTIRHALTRYRRYTESGAFDCPGPAAARA